MFITFCKTKEKKKYYIHFLVLALTLTLALTLALILTLNHLANELLQTATLLHGLKYLTFGSATNCNI